MSEAKSYAVVDTTQNPQKVINVVAWDQEQFPDYDFHAGHGAEDGLIIVQSDAAGKDYTYDPATGIFTAPVPLPDPVKQPTL